jgi:hypothetical protein
MDMSRAGLGGWGRRHGAGAVALAELLPEGVSAILRPHLDAALAAYARRDQGVVLAAYGAGSLLLCDLLSQEKSLPGWREAGFKTLRLLSLRAALHDPLDERGLFTAFRAAEDLAQETRAADDHGEICRMLNAAVAELKAERTAGRGAVSIRAAMARLEALAFGARIRPNLAA